MAEGSDVIDDKILSDSKDLLWGTDLKDEVFLRWSQGEVSTFVVTDSNKINVSDTDSIPDI